MLFSTCFDIATTYPRKTGEHGVVFAPSVEAVKKDILS